MNASVFAHFHQVVNNKNAAIYNDNKGPLVMDTHLMPEWFIGKCVAFDNPFL